LWAKLPANPIPGDTSCQGPTSFDSWVNLNEADPLAVSASCDSLANRGPLGRRSSVTYKSLTRLAQSGLVSRESHFSMRFSLIEHERGFERHGDDHQKNRMAQRFFISEPNFLSSRLLVIGNENQGSLLITAHLYKKMDCLSNTVCIFYIGAGSCDRRPLVR